MRPLFAAALIPLVAACGETSTSVDRITNVLTPEEQAACVAATAAEAGVPAALFTVSGARAEATGPALLMNANGQAATCKLDAAGAVTSVEMG